jgi:hypothetical protein
MLMTVHKEFHILYQILQITLRNLINIHRAQTHSSRALLGLTTMNLPGQMEIQMELIQRDRVHVNPAGR